MEQIWSAQRADGPLAKGQIEEVVQGALGAAGPVRKALLLHPDYSRHDFSSLVAPLIYNALEGAGLERLDTLNASGTHRPMSMAELEAKLGLTAAVCPLVGGMYNHRFDDPLELVHLVDIAPEFTAEKTNGHLKEALGVTINKRLLSDYDLVIALSGTVPHEATGFSGGTKIFFPGVSGPEVTGLFHWAAVLIGIPDIIGKADNPAREVVNAGAEALFERLSGKPVVCFNMVYTEDKEHCVVPNGLFAGEGSAGFAAALRAAAGLSAKLHIKHLEQSCAAIVQQIPAMYDEIWTAGKGSYKLQRPGVVADGGEIILYAPHIGCFHSNKKMDAEIREVGYHGRDYVVEFCRRRPGFNRNVAAHVINVRGIGGMENGVERFPFRVTLATAIPERECRAVGLGYRDPGSLKEEDFCGPGKLWIREGGQWLYSRS